MENIPLIIITDCNSLFENIYSINPHCQEEGLHADLHEIREACVTYSRLSPDYNGITIDLWWIPTKWQLADPLTKTSGDHQYLFSNYSWYIFIKQKFNGNG